MLTGMHPAPHTVAAGFAQERDVHYAVRLLSVAVDTKIDFTMRCVRGEDASMQLCILVASFADPAVASRIETRWRARTAWSCPSIPWTPRRPPRSQDVAGGA